MRTMQYPTANPPPPESGVVPCLYCGKALDVAKGYEQVVGLRCRRDGGGPNQITLPKPTGRWACADCVDRLKAGVHPLQTSLVP